MKNFLIRRNIIGIPETYRYLRYLRYLRYFASAVLTSHMHTLVIKDVILDPLITADLSYEQANLTTYGLLTRICVAIFSEQQPHFADPNLDFLRHIWSAEPYSLKITSLSGNKK